jgi:hypothetical protein
MARTRKLHWRRTISLEKPEYKSISQTHFCKVNPIPFSQGYRLQRVSPRLDENAMTAESTFPLIFRKMKTDSSSLLVAQKNKQPYG